MGGCRYLSWLLLMRAIYAAEEEEKEEKLGSKVYALNKSPSSVHSELDASLYKSNLDSPHKRQNSFALHMLHGALQVNPGCAVTSR